jgi:hypothetical protein
METDHTPLPPRERLFARWTGINTEPSMNAMNQQPFGIAPVANSRLLIIAVLALILGVGTPFSTAQSEDTEVDDLEAQVLTRGPVHEAFADIVSYNPEPGVVVEKAPPEPIEELPPEIRPEGDNITWIPGYWGWDDERSDFLWISGTWRALPPGRQWTTGYWGTAGQNHQWISGYWADASVEETTYLPKPPETVEAGPNVEAPSHDHTWTPGSWVWNRERYAWRSGYWAEGRSDWDWIPAHYVWTPRGYVFVDGYWDYGFARRGVLYAPVYFQSGYHSRPGYTYSPVIAIGLLAMMDHLFLRPDYHHYYFGDYYDRRYRGHGYYPPHAYQSSRRGYDPIYSYRRWSHRQDREWERRDADFYDYRRDHEEARPPRTWADMKRLGRDPKGSKDTHAGMAAPFAQMANRADSRIRTEQVSAEDRRRLTDMSREVRKTGQQRRTLEARGTNDNAGGTGRDIKPTKARLPKSPIAGKAADRLPEKQAPPKPRHPAIDKAGQDPSKEKPESKKDRPETKKDRPETKKQPGSNEPDVRKQPTPPRGEVPPKSQRPQAKPKPPAEKEKPSDAKPVPKPKEPDRATPEPSRQPAKVTPPKPQEGPKPKAPGKDDKNPASGGKSKPAEQDSEPSTGKSRKKDGH